PHSTAIITVKRWSTVARVRGTRCGCSLTFMDSPLLRRRNCFRPERGRLRARAAFASPLIFHRPWTACVGFLRKSIRRCAGVPPLHTSGCFCEKTPNRNEILAILPAANKSRIRGTNGKRTARAPSSFAADLAPARRSGPFEPRAADGQAHPARRFPESRRLARLPASVGAVGL